MNSETLKWLSIYANNQFQFVKTALKKCLNHLWNLTIKIQEKFVENSGKA